MTHALSLAMDVPPRESTPPPRVRVVAEPPDFVGILTMNLRDVLELTDDVLLAICRDNEHLRFEVNAEGDLVIMSPTGARTGDRNSELNMQVRLWARRDGRGVTFDSSTFFRLPNGARRIPDVAWVLRERLQAVRTTADPEPLIYPVCPDFVCELRSPTDRLKDVEEKMREYLGNGAQLGWLIDPISTPPHVQIYRPDQDVETLEQPNTISGDPVLPGLVVDLAPVWQPAW